MSSKIKSIKKKTTSLPAETVEYLKAWMMSPEHIAHPYPTEQEKSEIMKDTGIELKQLTNWFVNNRKRYWKPRVEARLQQHVPGSIKSPKTVKSVDENKASINSAHITLLDAIHLQTPPRSIQRRNSRLSLVSRESLSDGAPKSPASQRAVISDVSCSSGYFSDSASLDSSDFSTDMSEEIVNGYVSRTETVDFHVLRPMEGDIPTITDVSILANVPAGRILRSFESCPLTYRFPVASIQDRKKVQSRRDAEIFRMKRHYLKIYQEESGAMNLKRMRMEALAEVESTPRKKYCRDSPSMWRDACKSASHGFDSDLPSLEEASILFGIVNKVSSEHF